MSTMKYITAALKVGLLIITSAVRYIKSLKGRLSITVSTVRQLKGSLFDDYVFRQIHQVFER